MLDNMCYSLQDAYYACNLLLGIRNYPQYQGQWAGLYENGKLLPPAGVTLDDQLPGPRSSKLLQAWSTPGNTIYKPYII